jgi:hypothetical protein
MHRPAATVFERSLEALGSWNGEGRAPAYPLHMGKIVIVASLFPKFPGEIVVFPEQGYPGQDVSLFDVPQHTRLQVDVAADTIGRKMQRAFEGVRIIRHDEGYAVPDHPHAVLLPAERGAGAGLYRPTEFHPDDSYFESIQAMLALTSHEGAALDEKIERLEVDAYVYDAT